MKKPLNEGGIDNFGTSMVTQANTIRKAFNGFVEARSEIKDCLHHTQLTSVVARATLAEVKVSFSDKRVLSRD